MTNERRFSAPGFDSPKTEVIETAHPEVERTDPNSFALPLSAHEANEYSGQLGLAPASISRTEKMAAYEQAQQLRGVLKRARQSGMQALHSADVHRPR